MKNFMTINFKNPGGIDKSVEKYKLPNWLKKKKKFIDLTRLD